MGKVYTRSGDDGTTSLYGGSRIGKDSLRVGAYGNIDSANVSIGLAKAHISNSIYRDLLEVCQLKLFEIAAEVSSDEKGKKKLQGRIKEKDIAFLEEAIDVLSKDLQEQNFFSIPGHSKTSSFLHLARVDVRRGERGLVELSRTEEVSGYNLKYLNRLSDLLFVLSRVVDEKQEGQDQDRTGTSKVSMARAIERACFEKAKEISVPMAVAVTDEKGQVISFGVMDDTLEISYDLAKDKAYTAAVLRTETEKLKDLTGPQGSLYGLERKDRIVVFGGGVPLFQEGKLIGAIGVSGGSVEEDVLVVKAGEKAFMKGDRL